MNQYLEELLNIHWLRPETALWRAIDINSMQDFRFTPPSLDFGCGDGLFSFVRAKGKLDRNFNIYTTMTAMDQYFDNVDVYNCSEGYSVSIVNSPEYNISCGFDIKQQLLDKASHLNFYKNLLQGNANKVLPFYDGYFMSIFSNIIYWLDDPASVLAELNRVINDEGECCILLPDQSIKNYSFYHKLYIQDNNKDFEFLKKLDRGRMSENIKHAYDKNRWDKLILESGFKVKKHIAHHSKPVIQMWDIGLRPLFPLLKKLIDNVDVDLLNEIKKEWVSLFMYFIEPIVELDKKFCIESKPAFHCYILKK